MRKKPMYSWARVLLAGAVVMFETGCTSTKPHSTVCTATPDGHASNVFLKYPQVFKIDGRYKRTDRLTPGEHVITVRVDWTVSYFDNTDLIVNAAADQVLVIYAIMVPEEHNETIYVEQQQFDEAVEYFIIQFIGTAVGALRLIPWLAYEGIKYVISPPKGRPEGMHCYVWIEDRDTRRLLSGERPDNLVDRTGRRIE